jgi:hypothetical protein
MIQHARPQTRQPQAFREELLAKQRVHHCKLGLVCLVQFDKRLDLEHLDERMGLGEGE